MCGAVRFAADGVETGFHACHCGTCRRWSGGSPFFGVSVASVEFVGEGALGRRASSDWAERGFCRECGSTLFYFYAPEKKYTLSIGAFDEQAAFVLTGEIFIESKPAGYDLAGDHPRLTGAEAFAALSSE